MPGMTTLIVICNNSIPNILGNRRPPGDLLICIGSLYFKYIEPD